MTIDKRMRVDYLRDNPADELEDSLYGETWDKVRKSWGWSNRNWGSNVVHHMWRGGVGKKLDLWSLLITVSPAAHDYVHKCPKHGVVACLYTKMKKGEYNNEEVLKHVGRNLLGLVSLWKETEEVTHPYYVDLITEIENGIVRNNNHSPS